MPFPCAITQLSKTRSHLRPFVVLSRVKSWLFATFASQEEQQFFLSF